MYEQTLYKVLSNHIKPKILSRMNRYKKWEYGYNDDHDMIIISKTGQIGDVYEIQNLKIALPKQNDVFKFEEYVEDNVMVELDQSQFDALVAWTFNLGPGNLRESTMLKKLNDAD